MPNHLNWQNDTVHPSKKDIQVFFYKINLANFALLFLHQSARAEKANLCITVAVGLAEKQTMPGKNTVGWVPGCSQEPLVVPHVQPHPGVERQPSSSAPASCSSSSSILCPRAVVGAAPSRAAAAGVVSVRPAGHVHRGEDPAHDADDEEHDDDHGVAVDGRVRDGLHVLQGLEGGGVAGLQLEHVAEVEGRFLHVHIDQRREILL